jgi:TolB protein
VSAIIRADLERSGVFKVIDAGQDHQRQRQHRLRRLEGRGADALVVGSVQRLADGRFEVRYKLLDTVKGSQLSQLDAKCSPRNTRLEAHRIADDVYEKLTGTRGIFSTRIAYVKENRAGNELRAGGGRRRRRGEQVAAFGSRADHLAGLVAGRHQGRLRLVREEEAGGLRAEPGDRPAHA